MKHLSLIILLNILSLSGFAQNFNLSGTIMDSTDNTPLIGVNIVLRHVRDTTQWKGTITDISGRFQFTNVQPGNYSLTASFIGYAALHRRVAMRTADVSLGELKMGQSVTTLKSVEVKGAAIQVEQKGDTVQYNANAFKTNRDANAEDLITKMPGITSDNTGIKAQGENVQQVLVDGKPFFGDDPAMAIKNLPAEIIDKIEVFDRLSDQAQFTGFDDGQTRKTINIVTKKGKNNGQFGKLYAGVGEDGRYIGGGNINLFKDSRKLSLIGLSNNINQQNFSSEDLLGVSSVSSGGGQGGSGGRGGGGRGFGGGGSGNNGGGASNFLVGQQGGISTTNAIGFNYSNNWGKKIDVTGSYFFNNADNKKNTILSRTYITPEDSGLFYLETSQAASTNYNHRVNFRLEYKIDTANSLIVTPRLSFQKNDSRSALLGSYNGAENEVESQIDNNNYANNTGYNFSNNILYRHRFAKRGRSFSLNVGTEINNRDGESGLYSLNEYYSTNETTLIDQHSDQYTNSYTLSSNIAYTEPIGKNGQLQFNYSPSVTKSTTDKETYNLNPETERYSMLDTLLTNKFENTYFSNRAGASYRRNVKKYNMMVGLNFQHASLSSDQDFPVAFQLDRSFQNILPQAMFNYRIAEGENLRLMYRTATDAPSIAQLQNVVDNRNPLFLKTGNPDLKQNYNHSLTLRYGKTKLDKSSSFLIYLYGNYIQDYIGNSSFIAAKDTVLNGIALNRGTQLTAPVNLSGYWNTRGFVTYGLPIKGIKSNVNFNTSFTYNRIPALINNTTNLAHNYAFSEGVVLSSNISEKIDFTLSYTGNYTIVKNTMQEQSDNNYFNHVASLRMNWLFWKGFVFNTTLNNTMYSGLSAAFDQSIWFWNAGLGYKFLKDRAFEVKVTAFDLLNQNNSINRNVTETYIEDSQTNVLTRYFMLTLTYNLRNFK